MEGSLPVLGIHEQRWAIYSGWQTNAWAGNRIMVDIPKLLATETRRIVRRLAFLHRLDVCDLVPYHDDYDGYSRVSLTRASGVVKRQLIVAC
jgi:hypothetical protein